MRKLFVTIVSLLWTYSSIADEVTPILNITKCAGLGLKNLTPQDLLSIKEALNYSDPNINRNTPQLIEAQGYPVESHYIITEDGYILNVFRIPNPNSTNGVVFLQHGLLSSSDAWLLNYPTKNLPYILADLGYDVWLGNSRGNLYSRNHTSLDPNEPLSQFWDFSWHEMGTYDLPATIDYILSVTGLEKLIYVGHSQGTTQYFAGISTRPEYNSKIRIMVALAPTEFMNGTNSAVRLLAGAEFPGLTDSLACAIGADGTGAAVDSAQDDFLTELLPLGCSSHIIASVVCDVAFFLLAGYDYYQTQNELIPVAMNHFPQGTSMKSLVHYGQLVNNNKFQQFDYGTGYADLDELEICETSGASLSIADIINKTGLRNNFTLLGIPSDSSIMLPKWLVDKICKGNMGIYNSSTVPEYDLSLVTAPVVLFAGLNDALAGLRGVDILGPKVSGNIDFQNEPPYRLVPYPCFNHIDFNGIARDINTLLNNKLTQLLLDY